MTILDLPKDVLLSIFDHFQDTAVDRKPRNSRSVNDDEPNYRQTIQSVRLTCRLLNELASPLLYPALEVHLDQASLDRVDDISRSPFVAAGVRAVQVVLSYRPRELAEDLSRFKDHRKEDLNNMSRWCHHYSQKWFFAGHLVSDETVCPLPYSEYMKAEEYYGSICNAWDDTDGKAMDADSLKHQRLLRQCYEEYRQKHEEQLRLITDGSFVNILALSISRMARCEFLRFVDYSEHKWDQTLCAYYGNPTVWVNNLEDFTGFMAGPHDWHVIEELEGGAGELSPVRVLSELPIAIYKAGTALRELEISCFPLTSENCATLRPVCHNRQGEVWADFNAACQHLENFNFGGGSFNHQTRGHRDFMFEREPSVDQYLGTILSGHSLQAVDLNFYALGQYRIGPALGMISLQIRQACIRYASLSQDELETFCNRALGCDRLELISLSTVELWSGSWANALDLLREKVLLSARHSRGVTSRVTFSGLTGGEFGEKKEESPYHVWDLQSWTSEEEPLLVQLSETYVSGVEGGAVNPLKGIEFHGLLETNELR